MSLGAPTNLKAVVVSTTEVALSWDSVDGAILYHISVNGELGPVAVETFANVTELEPGENTFAVRAEGFDGFESVLGPWSETITVDTSTAAPAPPAELATPVIDTARPVGLDGAEIGWGAVEGAEGYEVRIDGGAPIDVGNVLGYAEDGLDVEERTYEVRAYNKTADPDLFSDWSASVTIAILAGLAAPEVEATVLSDTVIDLTWLAVPGADRYEVRINAATPIPAGSLLEFRASGLGPDTTYSFEVRAVVLGDPDPDTFGPWSEPVSATTFPFVAPPVVTPILKRLAYFMSNRGVSARAVNAELNNIYLLLGSELGFTSPSEDVEDPSVFEPEADEPEPAPLPEPDEEPLPPPPPPPAPEPTQIMFCRNLQDDLLSGNTTAPNGDLIKIYDLLQITGTPLAKVIGRTTSTSNLLRLGWVIEVGTLLQGVERLKYTLKLGDVGPGGGFRVRFDRVRLDGSSVQFAGLGSSFNDAVKFSTISRLETSNSPPGWSAGDRLRLSMTMFRTTGAEMFVEAFTESNESFIDLEPLVGCDATPPPVGTTQDTSILLDSTVTKTFASVFNAFPGTGNDAVFRIRENKYAALSFNTGNLASGTGGTISFNNTPRVHVGKLAVSITKCPGDFGPHLDERCRRLLDPKLIPNRILWRIDEPPEGGRCPLEANTDYFLNIMPATSLPADGTPTWDGSGGTSAGAIGNARLF